jgi:hypothetical protein
VAQIGAAIGREFSHALLAAVVRKPEPEMASALDRQISAGLPFQQVSMHWCRTRLMARCCASGDAYIQRWGG